MKVTIKVEEVSNILRDQPSTEYSIFCSIRHNPSNYSSQTKLFPVRDNVATFDENSEFTFPVDSAIEPVIVTVLNNKEEDIASLDLVLSDFSNGKATEKSFNLMPMEGYSDKGTIRMNILVNITQKDETVKAEPIASVQNDEKGKQGNNNQGKQDDEDFTTVKTKEERNREKAELLEVSYDEIYEKALAAANERYGQILAENGDLLIQNEQWVNENCPSNESGQNADPPLESSGSDV